MSRWTMPVVGPISVRGARLLGRAARELASALDEYLLASLATECAYGRHHANNVERACSL